MSDETRPGGAGVRRAAMRRAAVVAWAVAWVVAAGALTGRAAAAESAAAAAGAAPDASLVERVAALERQIEALRAEVARLRESSPAGQAVAAIEAKIDALSRDIEALRLGQAAPPTAGPSSAGLGPAASKVYRAPRGVSIGGYGEVVYDRPRDVRDDGSPSGEIATADVRRAVLYFGYKFDDRLLFNSELEVEHAVASSADPGEVEVEFAYVDWRRRPAFGARGGLLLVPLGLINELHEPPVFFGVDRPEVETFLIPTTWREIGGGVYGDSGPFAWKAYLVTSLRAADFSAEGGFEEGKQEGALAAAEDLALTARLDWTPAQGLLLGAGGFGGGAAQGQPGVGSAQVRLFEAHAEWRWRGLRTRALLARTRLAHAAEVSALAGETIGSRMTGYYLEAGWNVLFGRRGDRDLSPFLRYESFDTQAGVPAGFAADPASERRVRTVGVQYRPIPAIVLKADWKDEDNGARTGVDRFTLGLGWLF